MSSNDKDSTFNTFKVAILLCLVCSLLVSATAIGLMEIQKTNVALDKKKNILTVAGYTPEEVKKMSKKDIEEIFKGENESIQILDIVVDLETGLEVSNDDLKEKTGFDSVVDFDQEKIVKQEGLGSEIEGGVNIGLRKRENYSHVYVVKDKKKDLITRYVFPVKGKGLWSTLMGYIAVDASFKQIEGLTFYSHKETPGLGGEVDNPKWKKLWEGRMLFSEDGQVANDYVVKGSPDESNRNAVAGLSGATITSKGVSNLVRYWMGEEGFGKFISEVQNN
ncbi:Na(+)-translocating NADH-quinone reductase subunit C [bacterium]|jgi:Na+-transporting NADH:ubiquinone oxidoreductase subunit C|nr:Na(+)-translocating NADH-quinone reductase subunit C [bacterium]MDB4413394.1 Na(+)-translocating NADH-quinone reductase subunit C [Pirellulaceae bacterium]MDB4640391.1 Na(+)-translocating NADH-quinone reductase subunit C [Pirellulaceae bacterium]MDB4650291.1 Na(+)-translocating NADH-quinone reductase subunit C [Pirellulaceae bacterium]